PRQADAGALHQVERGHALLLDRPRVHGAHLRRLVERVEPVRQAHRRIATAPAVVSVWVSEITGSAPSSRARSATAPLKRSAGGPPVATTSTSRKLQPSMPSAFATASFAQKRAARWRPGRPCPAA